MNPVREFQNGFLLGHSPEAQRRPREESSSGMESPWRHGGPNPRRSLLLAPVVRQEAATGGAGESRRCMKVIFAYLCIHETAHENPFRVSHGPCNFKDLVTLAMRPPTASERFAGDRCRERWHGTSGSF